MKHKTPNKNKYWWTDVNGQEKLFYIRRRAEIGALGIAAPIEIAAVTTSIMTLSGPPQVLVTLGLIVFGMLAWMGLAGYLCDRAKASDNCRGFHPFHLYHNDIKYLPDHSWKEAYLSHATYKEAVETMVDSMVKDHDTVPWTRWKLVAEEMNAAMLERKKILTKQQEDATLSNYAEAIQLENKMLSGDTT